MKKVFMSLAVVAMIAMVAACGNNQAAEEVVEETVECACDSCCNCDSCAACQADTVVVAE